ncbi:MAG: tRNA pseudouridine(38-40) synthase TruA [Bacteroidales bacterium]|nr:tRNA pseudouridine(38-40) synthase TruA [Bacteroidales bacterium]
MQRYFVKLSYKGTRYHGWQRQPNAVSVQQTIEQALGTLLKETIEVTGCGRTDTGVHAAEYYLHFDSTVTIEDKVQFAYKLNCILPYDIAVCCIYEVPGDMHARFSAKNRTYKYYVQTRKDPFVTDTAWLFTQPLDLGAMNQAAEILLETTDFTSFCKLHGGSNTNVCKVTNAFWLKNGNQLVFTITADRFLRNMVRAIVGTLVEIGLKKMSVNEFKEIIALKDRNKASFSADAKGLHLTKIEY